MRLKVSDVSYLRRAQARAHAPFEWLIAVIPTGKRQIYLQAFLVSLQYFGVRSLLAGYCQS